MRKSLLSILILYFSFTAALSQDVSADSTLQEVIVEAYAADRPLHEIPASVAYLSLRDINRFNNTSLLPAINTVPGVRMEERSPGSYRFSIRGSSVRSPFGVRNVKMYWNGLPFTDAGGNTYLNLIDVEAINNIEVIKGPGGGLYGAGTGGVILLRSTTPNENSVEISTLHGSYGLQRYSLGGKLSNEKVSGSIRFSHQQAGGYREQTKMERDALNTDLNFALTNKSILSATLLYTDLFYETPGGLTLSQYNVNARQARPSSGPSPGAVEQHAAVNNKTVYGGLMHSYEWTDKWSTKTGVYSTSTIFSNPTIRNVEDRDELNLGGRIETKYRAEKNNVKTSITFGGEFQYFDSSIKIYENNLGVTGAITSDDDLSSQLILAFGQGEISFDNNFFITLGASLNWMKVDYERILQPVVTATRDFKPVFSPRIALLKKLRTNLSVYGSFSRGFSPPTIAELYPSRAIFDRDLAAEQGNNIEFGVKGNALNNALLYELTLYDFQLDETIVIRRDTTLLLDPEYFVNAGKTSQRGVEASVTWNAYQNKDNFITNLKLWANYTYNHYRFRNYVKGDDDISQNKLTGVPPTTFNFGLDISVRQKFYANVTGNYVDHIPLNDENTVYSSEYFLLGTRIGYRGKVFEKHGLEIFGGVDNALDKRYSLGNDLNAVGGRFFNAASPRNYYVGLKLNLSFEK